MQGLINSRLCLLVYLLTSRHSSWHLTILAILGAVSHHSRAYPRLASQMLTWVFVVRIFCWTESQDFLYLSCVHIMMRSLFFTNDKDKLTRYIHNFGSTALSLHWLVVKKECVAADVVSLTEMLDNDSLGGPDLVTDAALPRGLVSPEHGLLLVNWHLQLLNFKPHNIALKYYFERTKYRM